MEKTIKLKINETKDIMIIVNEKLFATIYEDNRSIKADEIYKLFDYSRGDKYTVEIENEMNLDVPVIQFFKELFEEIITHLNALSSGTNNIELEAAQIDDNKNLNDYIFDEEVPF